MRKITFAAAATALLGLVVSAHAAPMISYEIFDGTTLIGSGNSTLGFIIGTGADSNFSVSLQALGAPDQPSPNLSSSTFNISTSGAAGTLTVEVTDYNQTSSATPVANTFTTNSLDGGGFTSDTISNYYDNTNTAFGTGTLLATSTFSGIDSFSSGPFNSMITPTGLYSDTSIYTLRFAAGTPFSSVTASSQINSIATTPEPNSLVLLGTGLVGAAGLLFMRRRNAAEGLL